MNFEYLEKIDKNKFDKKSVEFAKYFTCIKL